MFHKILVIAIMVSMIGFCFAESDASKGIGVQFGTSSGSGYSYRWMGENHGFQFTIGAISYGTNDLKFPSWVYDDDIEMTSDGPAYSRKGIKTSMSAGLNYIHVIDKSRSSTFYIVAGGSIGLHNQKMYRRYYDQSSPGSSSYTLDLSIPAESYRDKETRWTLGAGPGFELALDKHFKFSIDLPFTVNSDEEMVMYVPQVGLYYYFK